MRPFLQRVTACLGVLVVAGLAVAASPSLEPNRASQVAGLSRDKAISRDDVWRNIFARPKIEILGRETAAKAALGAKLFAERGGTRVACEAKV